MAGLTSIVLGVSHFYGATAGAQAPVAGLPISGYTVVHTYPHDANAFTQGLQYLEGVLYEGTGLNGRSSIRKVKFETGEVLQQRTTRPEHFGEGITIWESDLIQLTWQSGLAFVYDRSTFEPRRTFTYVGEGWGLTHDDVNLI
jgi:glutamine cyclotransferase